MCPGCAYRKAKKRPKRHKGYENCRKIHKASKPGEVVSTDQLVSPTPRFVLIHRGRPTLQQYLRATVFVDRFLDLTYIFLMTRIDGEATVEAKAAFERFSHNTMSE